MSRLPLWTLWNTHISYPTLGTRSCGTDLPFHQSLVKRCLWEVLILWYLWSAKWPKKSPRQSPHCWHLGVDLEAPKCSRQRDVDGALTASATNDTQVWGLNNLVDQGLANYCPRATSGPLPPSVWPMS